MDRGEQRGKTAGAANAQLTPGRDVGRRGVSPSAGIEKPLHPFPGESQFQRPPRDAAAFRTRSRDFVVSLPRLHRDAVSGHGIWTPRRRRSPNATFCGQLRDFWLYPLRLRERALTLLTSTQTVSEVSLRTDPK